ncbi:MAG: ATP-dependent zinc metalloprotease FtsH [Verrucomicrobiaceae bacterium]|nr:ATP-dependent zinc metalloprotease FtsH [Verrucomicrobiaceae bacterium]
MNKNQDKSFFAKPYVVWLLIAAIVIALVSLPEGNGNQLQKFDVKKLATAVDNDAIVKMSVRGDPKSGKDWYYINGEVKNPLFDIKSESKDVPRTLKFTFEGRVTEDLYKKISNPNSPWEIKEEPASSFWSDLLISVLPIVLIMAIIYFVFMRQFKGGTKGALDFGKSRARLITPDENKTKFSDVAGCDESKEEVSEIVEFLKNPKRFNDIGAKIPKGILMVGPPGTGKTLLARAVAGEADVPFFSISGSDFVEMFVGVGAARVRDMFDQAKRNAPCLIFIDEIDAVGRQRGAGMGGGNDEREQTLNSLLVEMDGFDAHSGIIIIAATNRPDVLDNALLRPGRFDRQVVIDLPDIKGREEILKIHAKKIKLDESVDLAKIAKITPGCSGADLANLLNESAIIAARRRSEKVSSNDISEARDKIFFGKERKKLMDDDQKRLTAYHEAGHALVQAVLDDEGKMPIHKVTIIPRGQSLGSTMFIPAKDEYTSSKKSLLRYISMCLGGRVAEEIIFGDITNGATADIKQATQTARKMVCDWGMSELGPVALGGSQDHIFLGKEIARDRPISDKTAEAVDATIRNIIETQLQCTRDIINENRAKLDLIAEELLIRETIDGEDVYSILKGDFVPTNKDEWEQLQKQKQQELEAKKAQEIQQSSSDNDAMTNEGGALPTA